MPSKSDCTYCKLIEIRKSTQFTCKTCKKRLCVSGSNSCFNIYHSVRILPKKVNIFCNSLLNIPALVKVSQKIINDFQKVRNPVPAQEQIVPNQSENVEMVIDSHQDLFSEAPHPSHDQLEPRKSDGTQHS